jgi:hypothetical protein
MLPERFGTYLCREGFSLTLTGDPCDSLETPKYMDNAFPMWNNIGGPHYRDYVGARDAGDTEIASSTFSVGCRGQHPARAKFKMQVAISDDSHARKRMLV